MDIPVFHDDQHGTAIITMAGMINAMHLTGRDVKTTKLVCNGAGAAGIACLDLARAMGFAAENVLLCDTKGVVYQGRTEGMNQWKSAHAVTTDRRTLTQAMEGCDVFFGLSIKGALTLGENIADLAGLRIAYDAYHLSLKGKPASVIDGLTGDQRFFLGYAQVWRAKQRDAALLAQVTSDPHSPGQQRTATVRNFDPWYAAFKPKAGGKLYLEPDARVRIW